MFTNKNVHMIGIGGVSMSGIADILLSYGCQITGYDAKESELTKKLCQKGVKISYEANLENVEKADIVIYTAAIKDDNEELAYAKKLNKELYERSVFFGLMMKNYKNVLCISGTHGKSTTSGMVSSIFLEANLNPTIQIGAILPKIGGNDFVGDKEYFIAEACEYVDSFLDFFPTAEIILNIDNDHLDYFGNLDNIIKSFNRYTKLLPENGYLVINADDENTLIACKDAEKKITYGLENSANYMAQNIEFDEYGHPNYDLYINNEFATKISLSVSGKHNVYNSLAAIALCSQYISDLEVIKKALKEYRGVGRRFELLGSYNGCQVYDDYAHHPSEIKTTYESVKKTSHKENWAIFQPHTYSRTKDHLEDFGKVLANFDHVVIAEIYAAREDNIYNVHSNDIVKLIQENGNNNAVYIDSFEKIEKYIKENVTPGDLIITVGAGPINEVAKALVK